MKNIALIFLIVLIPLMKNAKGLQQMYLPIWKKVACGYPSLGAPMTSVEFLAHLSAQQEI